MATGYDDRILLPDVDPLNQGVSVMLKGLLERIIALEKTLAKLMPDPNLVYGIPATNHRAKNLTILAHLYDAMLDVTDPDASIQVMFKAPLATDDQQVISAWLKSQEEPR